MAVIKPLIYDEKPSRKLDHRPFFSIIIPCYNSKDTIGDLLASIESQNMNDDIEVIISDDNSTESYQDIVDNFRDRLCIIQTKTEYNFAPGNTREQGVKFATGEWIAFADHDDLYITDTLPQVKEYILEHDEKHYAIANFLEVDPVTQQVRRQHIQTRNWNHAKFYNMDNFWKPYNIHFKKDLLTHEDIYISSCVNCGCNKFKCKPLEIPLFCYIWNARPTSLSRKDYEGREFLEVYFRDYIASTGDLYNEKFAEGEVDFEFAKDSAVSVIFFNYFYTMGFKFHRPDDWIRENDDYCREYLITCKELYNLTNKDILDYAAKDNCSVYYGIRDGAMIATGPCIETISLPDWLNYLHKDLKPRITMNDSLRKEK